MNWQSQLSLQLPTKGLSGVWAAYPLSPDRLLEYEFSREGTTVYAAQFPPAPLEWRGPLQI